MRHRIAATTVGRGDEGLKIEAEPQRQASQAATDASVPAWRRCVEASALHRLARQHPGPGIAAGGVPANAVAPCAAIAGRRAPAVREQPAACMAVRRAQRCLSACSMP